jgi:hypothetical protein
MHSSAPSRCRIWASGASSPSTSAPTFDRSREVLTASTGARPRLRLRGPGRQSRSTRCGRSRARGPNPTRGGRGRHAKHRRDGHAPVHFGAEHGFVDTPVHRRDTLTAGMVLAWPMVIEQLDSTVVLPPARGARSPPIFTSSFSSPEDRKRWHSIAYLRGSKNAYGNLVDQFRSSSCAPSTPSSLLPRLLQLLATPRATRDAGLGDIAVHVGTLHFTCKSIVDASRANPPGRRLQHQRPLYRRHAFATCASSPPDFVEGELIAFTQSNGTVRLSRLDPGLLRHQRPDHSRGAQISPKRVCEGQATRRRGRDDRRNTRAGRRHGRFPRPVRGHPPGEQRLLELSRNTARTPSSPPSASARHVERFARQRSPTCRRDLETTDFIDQDPTRPEG